MFQSKSIVVMLAMLVVLQAHGQTTASSFTLLSSKQTTSNEKDALAGDRWGEGEISKNKKSVTYKGLTPEIYIHTGPEDDMLSFRIKGLRNPTLVVKPGAELHIVFANTDDDMLHDIRFGSVHPPYGATPSTQGTAGSEALKRVDGDSVSAETFTLKVPSTAGTYYYFCSMKGHANGGMFGKVVVK